MTVKSCSFFYITKRSKIATGFDCFYAAAGQNGDLEGSEKNFALVLTVSPRNLTTNLFDLCSCRKRVYDTLDHKPITERVSTGADNLVGGLECQKDDGLWLKSKRHAPLQLFA